VQRHERTRRAGCRPRHPYGDASITRFSGKLALAVVPKHSPGADAAGAWSVADALVTGEHAAAVEALVNQDDRRYRNRAVRFYQGALLENACLGHADLAAAIRLRDREPVTV
jgi:hypothetical protein